jgi:hypothetical protein
LGKIIYPNGDIYEGSVIKMQKHGPGKIFFKKSGTTFEG